jgi:hypothetical protein
MGLFIVVHHIIYIICSTAYRQNKKDQHLPLTIERIPKEFPQPSSGENWADSVVSALTKEMCPGRIELQILPVCVFRCIFLFSSRGVIYCRNILWDLSECGLG